MATTATPDFHPERRTGADRRHAARAAAVEARRVSATTVLATPTTDGVKVSWGGIWGGVLTAIGLLLLLGALGVAVGVTATDPREADAGTLGTAAGLWAAASLLIALFVGGMVATRIGATFDRSTGFWEGALVWVVSLLLMAWLATSGVSSLAGGALSVMGGPQQAASSALQAQGGPATAAGPGGMVEQLRSRVEQATAGGSLQERAAQVKPAASRAAWIGFAGLVLSLAASLLGAMAGRRRRDRLVD